VSALDISAVGIARGRRAAQARGLAIDWVCADLDDDPAAALPAGPFDLIVWVRYIHRTLLPHLLVRLAPGGALLCEQHLTATASVVGPSAAFRFEPGELARGAAELDVLHSYEGLLVDPDGCTAAVAQLVGTKRTQSA
jgi:hypothetical protein